MLGLRRKRRQLFILNTVLALWFCILLYTKTQGGSNLSVAEIKVNRNREIKAEKDADKAREKRNADQHIVKDYFNDTLLQSKYPNKRLIFQPTLPSNFNPNAMGENGESVIVPAKDKAESDKLFKMHGFNQWASDHISLHRTLPDFRHAL